MAWGFLSSLTGAGVGAIADGVGDLAIKVRQAFTGEMSPEDKADVEKMLIEMESKSMVLKAEVTKMQSSIIVAEAKSGTFLASNWRPITMLVFVFIIFNNYILFPYLSLMWSAAPALPIPDHMWELLKIGLGGYVLGRSAEKSSLNWNKGKTTIGKVHVIIENDNLSDKAKLKAIKKFLATQS